MKLCLLYFQQTRIVICSYSPVLLLNKDQLFYFHFYFFSLRSQSSIFSMQKASHRSSVKLFKGRRPQGFTIGAFYNYLPLFKLLAILFYYDTSSSPQCSYKSRKSNTIPFSICTLTGTIRILRFRLRSQDSTLTSDVLDVMLFLQSSVNTPMYKRTSQKGITDHPGHPLEGILRPLTS